MKQTVALYWGEGKLYPQAADILNSVLAEYGVTKVYEWTPGIAVDIPVLGLNAEPPEKSLRFVNTLSQKQIMSGAAAVTELNAALDKIFKPVQLPKMQYEVWEAGSTKTLERYFSDRKPLVIDIETGSHGRNYKFLIPEETYLLSMALFDGEKRIVVLSEEWLADKANLDQLGKFLTSGRKLIAHNMKFDFRTLTEFTGYDIKGHFDTMLMVHAALPGSKEFGLEALCVKYLGVEDWKMEKVAGQYFARGNKDYAQIPRKVLYEYNARDVFNTWYLFEYFRVLTVDNERVIKLAKFEFEAANTFQEIEQNGLAVDLEYLNELEQTFTAQRDECLAKIRAMVKNENFNPNSHVQVKKYYESQGLALKSTGEDILDELRPTMGWKLAEFTDMLLEFRGVNKLLTTYVKGIKLRLHHGNLVFPTFLIHGTNTGRLSSSGPNIQNIPRDEEGVSLRRLFVPRTDPEGKPRTLLNVDYGQAELRVMAMLSKDPYLIGLFQPDSPDFFDALMPVAFPKEDRDAWDKDMKKNKRARLKATIYGLSYGRQAFAIAKSLKMPVKEARSIITNYFKQAPDLYDWRKWVTAVAVSEDDVLVTPFGRYFQSEVVTTRNKQNVINSSLAFLPQSTASDLCVSATIRIQQWLKDTGLAEHNHIIATVHDAILLDVREEDAQRIGERVQFEMADSGRRVFGDTVVFATDMDTGPSWKGI